MNREEALNKHKVAHEFGQSKDTYGRDVINAIYSDIESRTCANCEHFVSNFCLNEKAPEIIIGNLYKEFGCNMFSRK